MSFNPKQAQEGIFSCKLQKSNYPSLTFNSISVTQSEIQKHSGMFLDSKLDFKKHFKNVFNKVSKTITLLCKLQKMSPTPSSIRIYVSVNYGDIIHDQAYKVSFY